MAAGRFLKMNILRILDHSDDFNIRLSFWIVVRTDFSSHGIPGPKEITGHRLVDDGYHGMRGVILIPEIPSGGQGNAQAREISRRDYGCVDAHLLVRPRLIALHADALLVPATGKRRIRGQAYGLHSRQAANTHKQIMVQAFDSFLWIAVQRRIELREEHIFFYKTGVDSVQVFEAMPEQSGGDQQRQRKGHLEEYQAASQTKKSPAGSYRGSFIPQSARDRGVQKLPDWGETEQETRQERSQQRKSKDAQVQRHIQVC